VDHAVHCLSCVAVCTPCLVLEDTHAADTPVHLFLTPCVFLQRVARLVGNVDDDVQEFLRQTKHEFDALIALQNVENDFVEQDTKFDEEGKDGVQNQERTDCIIVEKLRAQSTGSSGMDGVGIGQLVMFFVQLFSAEVVSRIARYCWMTDTKYLNMQCTFFEQFDEDGDGQIDLEGQSSTAIFS